MRAVVILCIVALMAVVVSAQLNTVEPAVAGPKQYPAIMTKPADNLKKPLIFAPKTVKSALDSDAPHFGAIPQNFTKVNVTANIFGGVVEFRKGATPSGCPCRETVPEKFRYDAQFKPEAVKKTRCGCGGKKAKKSILPPVVAALKPRAPKNVTATAPCAKKVKKVKATIAPAYYPATPKVAAKAPCAKQVKSVKPKTIRPEFYPTRAERKAKRAAKKAKRVAAKKVAKAAKTTVKSSKPKQAKKNKSKTVRAQKVKKTKATKTNKKNKKENKKKF